LIHNQSTRCQRRWQVRRRLQPFLNAASNLKSADFLPAERGSLQSFHARSLHPPTPLRLIIFPQCQIAQFDCSVCTSEEADEAGTYRDDPRRIDSGHNLDVDEPSLQHSTAKCTAKLKNDPNNKDKRRLQGFFHFRSQRAGPRIHAQAALANPDLCGICGTQLSGNFARLDPKRSHFHVHPTRRKQGDQTWHFANRVIPWNTTSQRRRKRRRKSANSCAATS